VDKIETRKIKLGAFKLTKTEKEIVIGSSYTHLTFKLTAWQEQWLAQLNQGKTLEEIATNHITAHNEFSFTGLYGLLEILIELQLITDALVLKDLSDSEAQSADADKNARVSMGNTEALVGNWSTQHLANLPFFRNISADLLKTFLAYATLEKFPERTKIITIGDKSRDLFVLFEGEVSVYVPGVKHRRLITTIPAGSIFGEGSFFFGKPRSADVISNFSCIVARIKYDEKAFHSLIHSSGTGQLQQRLWILHGLLSSPLFQHVPADTMDRFVVAGKVRTLGPGELLFKQGDAGASFFVVIQGEVAVSQGEKLLKTFKKGDIFGEIALMINQGQRTASARASTQALLLEVHRSEFYKVLSKNLLLAKEIEEIALRRYKDL